MAIAYQEMIFQWGAVEQDVGERHVRTGGLTEAINVRMIQRLQYRKREGFSRTLPALISSVGFTFTSVTDDMGLVPGPNGTMFTIDGAGRAWSYDPVAIAWRDRGLVIRPFPQHTASISAAKLARPTIVIAGTSRWTFAITTGAYWYSVEDLTTGTVLQPPTKVTAANIVNLSAAYDNTNVWVVWVDTSTSATSHKYVNSTPATAAVSANYITVAGTSWRSVDMQWLAGPSLLAVVLGGRAAGGDRHTNRSYMNPATGAASGAPAAVTITDVSGANNQILLSSPSILVDSSGTTNWYFAVWKDINSIGFAGLVLYKVTTATLALAATTTVVSVANTNNTAAVGACCGYVAVNGDTVIYEHFDTLDVEPAPWNHVITKRVRGSVTTDTVWSRGQWLASKPVLLTGTSWYLMTGFEDDGIALALSIQARGVQRTYNLRDASDGSVVGQALSEEAGGIWHTTDSPTAANLGTHSAAKVPACYVVGSKIYAAAMMASGSLLDLSAGSIAWDFAAVYGLPVQALGRCLVPGGIPVIFGHQESVREVTPLDFPNYITTSAGGTLYQVAVCYRFTSPDGTFWRSAPLIGSLSIANGATITVPTLRNLLPGTTAVIEWYAGSAGVAFLQEVKQNDASVDSITFTFTSAALLVTDEQLYTTGGALDNAPLPPCKHVSVFQNRAVLAATPDKDIVWVSQEFRAQAGLQFNADLNSTWIKGSGEVSALADCGLFLALFRKDAIALISGPGPDGNATGNFVPQTIDVKETTDNFRGILPAERGAYFQANDGLIYQLQGANVVPVYAGMQSHSAERVVATLLNATASQAWFFTVFGLMVLDYGHPTPDQPAGQWFYWTSSAFTAFTGGACVDSAGTAWYVGAAGDLYKQTPGQWADSTGTTAPVLMKMRTGAMAPWGLLHGGRAESITFLGRFKGDCALAITPRTRGGATSTHTKASIATGGGEQLRFTVKPPALNRIPEFDVTLEETANAGNTEGFIWDGLAVRFQNLGLMPPGSGEVVP